MLNSGADTFCLSYLKDRNREMILMLIDKVEAVKDEKYISLLTAWKEIECKKVSKRLGEAINFLRA